MASIEVIQGPDKGRTIPLRDHEAMIGREGEALRLSDSTVSRRHARLSRQDGQWFIEDLGSANGTFVNSARISRPARLHVGDQIRCGQTLLVFGGPMPHAPPLDVDEDGGFLEATIRASVPANDDSVIIPTPEAGAEAIGTLRVIYEFANEVSSIFDLRQLAERVMNLTFDLVPAERGFVLLFGPDGELIPMASRYRDDDDKGRPLPISRTIINEVVARQVGIHSYNAMHDKRFSAGESVHDYGIRSAICVPIKGREKILGVIHVDASEGQDPYSTEQLRLLTAIGSQTGLAVENVRLYQAAIKSERLAAVGETVAALSHHIKNILQALGGGADVVEKALTEGNSERAGSTWPIIRRNLDRINAVILNMLAYSKPRRQMLETINVNVVIEDCVELATPLADEAGIALITDLGDLPPAPAEPADQRPGRGQARGRRRHRRQRVRPADARHHRPRQRQRHGHPPGGGGQDIRDLPHHQGRPGHGPGAGRRPQGRPRAQRPDQRPERPGPRDDLHRQTAHPDRRARLLRRHPHPLTPPAAGKGE